jgi:hypothetical protein
MLSAMHAHVRTDITCAADTRLSAGALHHPPKSPKPQTSALQEQLRKKEEKLDFTRKALADKEAELVNTLRGHNADLQSGFNMRVGTVRAFNKFAQGASMGTVSTALHVHVGAVAVNVESRPFRPAGGQAACHAV